MNNKISLEFHRLHFRQFNLKLLLGCFKMVHLPLNQFKIPLLLFRNKINNHNRKLFSLKLNQICRIKQEINNDYYLLVYSVYNKNIN